MIEADIHTLYQSGFFRITDYKCRCNRCSITEPEYNESFCLSFIRKGFFEYRTFRRKDEVYTGRILLSKPEYEHTTRHIDDQPDITTVFEFTPDFFREMQENYKEVAFFLRNDGIHAMLLYSNPQMDYMHNRILGRITRGQKFSLEIEELVLRLLETVFCSLSDTLQVQPVTENLKTHHLPSIEKAKEYIRDHFADNISMEQLAKHCYISCFHFSRIFKAVTRISPYQYLLSTRLQHAEALVMNTELPVNDIAFQCGFNSVENFIPTYKQHFKISPLNYRKQFRSLVS